jgi:catechol 2,3-dioxygenase-like lactoylglutathione lyase family enzyme
MQTGSGATGSISAVSHIALMTGDIDRLVDFYVEAFGAAIIARSEGSPRKCVLQLATATSLHLFEVPSERARQPGDDRFDPGSINHFALEARDPGTFARTHARLVQLGRTDDTVYEAPDLYTVFATDPDGLFVELTLRKAEGWDPPFETTPFVGLGQPAVPVTQSTPGLTGTRRSAMQASDA